MRIKMNAPEYAQARVLIVFLVALVSLGGFVPLHIRGHSAAGQTLAVAEESEVGKTLYIKNVLIGKSAKSVDCRFTSLKLPFLPWAQVGNRHFINRRPAGSQNVAALPQSCWWIFEERAKRKFQDANAQPHLYIVSGRVSVISYCDAHFASPGFIDLEDYTGAHVHIGTQFALSHFPILFVGFESNIRALPRRIGGLFGRLYRAPQLVSLIGANEDEKEGEGREAGVKEDQQNVQTILTLFVVAFFSVVAGFVLEFRGWADLGCGRRGLGWLWIGLGLSVSSFGLFSLVFGGWPWTWI